MLFPISSLSSSEYRQSISHSNLSLSLSFLRDIEIPKPTRLTFIYEPMHPQVLPSTSRRPAHRLRVSNIVHLHASMNPVKISGCGGPLTSLLASSTSGVSQCWRTGPTGGGGECVTAYRAACAPPQFVWPTTTTVASASGEAGY